MTFRMFQNQNYENLKNQLVKNKLLFEDDTFSATDSSLFRFKDILSDRKISWKRPHHICDNPKFIVNFIEPNDLDQGELGNCWVIAAAACMLTVPEYLNRVIPENQSFDKDNYAGIFHFRFWNNGEWVDVVVDDRLPVDQNSRLIFCKNSVDTNEMFGPLLEKAYAKLNICYEFLNGGVTKDALIDFTGGINETLNIKRSSNLSEPSRFIHPNKLWDIIFKSRGLKSLMSCSANSVEGEQIESKRENGIVVGHAYSIIEVYEISNYNQLRQIEDNLNSDDTIKLLRLRNPWGQKVSFSGLWSIESKEWNKISDKIKQKINSNLQNDGNFIINFEEFIENFDLIDLVHINLNGILNEQDLSRGKSKWNMTKYEGKWIPGVCSGGSKSSEEIFWSNPQYKINIMGKNGKKISVIISLLQTDTAKRKFETDGTFENSLEALGFKVYLINKNINHKSELCFVNGTKVFKYQREISKRIELSPGEYLIVPCMFEKDKLMGFVLRLFIECIDNQIRNSDSETCHLI